MKLVAGLARDRLQSVAEEISGGLGALRVVSLMDQRRAGANFMELFHLGQENKNAHCSAWGCRSRAKKAETFSRVCSHSTEQNATDVRSAY